jgi:hypothetical protein
LGTTSTATTTTTTAAATTATSTTATTGSTSTTGSMFFVAKSSFLFSFFQFCFNFYCLLLVLLLNQIFSFKHNIEKIKYNNSNFIFSFLAPAPNFNVYVNSLASGWEDWSSDWASDYSFAYTTLTHSAPDSIRFVPQNWEVLKKRK